MTISEGTFLGRAHPPLGSAGCGAEYVLPFTYKPTGPTGLSVPPHHLLSPRYPAQSPAQSLAHSRCLIRRQSKRGCPGGVVPRLSACQNHWGWVLHPQILGSRPRTPHQLSRGEAGKSASLQAAPMMLRHMKTALSSKAWPCLPGPAHPMTPGAPCLSEDHYSYACKRGLQGPPRSTRLHLAAQGLRLSLFFLPSLCASSNELLWVA